MTLLQMYHWVCQWKNFENRSTFGEVTDKSIVACFFDSQCRNKYTQMVIKTRHRERKEITSGLDISLCYSLYNVFEINLVGFWWLQAYLVLMIATVLLASVHSVYSNQTASVCWLWHRQNMSRLTIDYLVGAQRSAVVTFADFVLYIWSKFSLWIL